MTPTVGSASTRQVVADEHATQSGCQSWFSPVWFTSSSALGSPQPAVPGCELIAKVPLKMPNPCELLVETSAQNETAPHDNESIESVSKLSSPDLPSGLSHRSRST